MDENPICCNTLPDQVTEQVWVTTNEEPVNSTAQ